MILIHQIVSTLFTHWSGSCSGQLDLKEMRSFPRMKRLIVVTKCGQVLTNIIQSLLAFTLVCIKVRLSTWPHIRTCVVYYISWLQHGHFESSLCFHKCSILLVPRNLDVCVIMVIRNIFGLALVAVLYGIQLIKLNARGVNILADFYVFIVFLLPKCSRNGTVLSPAHLNPPI